MQMDVGFGDLIHPGSVQANYPALLDLPAPSLRMYPPETVIAEKAEAMVYLGKLNSRMKDFYDIWRIAQQFDFDGHELCEAVSRTFGNRNTEIIEFDVLVIELLDNDNPDQQWIAFLRKSALVGPESFSQVLAAISAFLTPVFSSIKDGNHFRRKWPATGPWRVDN